MCRVKLLWLLAFLLLGSVLAQQESSYSAVGGKLELSPDTSGVSKPFTNILWKYGPDFVVEWVKKELESYKPFQGRTTLNTETGHLTVSNLTTDDSGVYSVEFNSKVQTKTYKIYVINKVPKPSISSRPLACSASSPCSLGCDGDPIGAGPVTYSWKMDKGDWKVSEKLLNITNNKHVEKFSCQLKNPVSVEESEPYDNPFYSGEPPGGSEWIAAVVVPIVIFEIVGIVAWIHKDIWRWIRSHRKNHLDNGVMPTEVVPLNPEEEQEHGGAAPNAEEKSEDGGGGTKR